MTQRISVKNFLVVKKAELDIKRVNVLIGPQANGKSIIAKLVYFFKSNSRHINEAIRLDKTKRELDKSILDSFEERFPRYSWDATAFSIEYEFENVRFKIVGTKNSRGNKTNLSIEYSPELNNYIKKCKRCYQKSLTEARKQKDGQFISHTVERHLFFERVDEGHKDSPFKELFSNTAFIPASRSFFANLQKNIFTFLASNLDIDPFLKEFGGLYESSKRWYATAILKREFKDLSTELSDGLKSVVGGDYQFHEDQDWIVAKSRKINLANASSGQQESLPMLLVLSTWPLMSKMSFARRGNFSSTLFIEEPEAHLFPTSQSHIMSLLSVLYASSDTDFFITTHSPYILSALNNLVLAKSKVDEGKITVEEFTKINGGGRPVSYDDISAHTISQGQLEQITDDEYQMIGADMLDSVSEHFESVMNNLLER
ncbi:AAA family ATPase [Vibrio cyclitrophicus]